jgi:hypothetical protein
LGVPDVFFILLAARKQKQTNKLVHCIAGHSKKEKNQGKKKTLHKHAVDLLKDRLGVGVTFGLQG